MTIALNTTFKPATLDGPTSSPLKPLLPLSLPLSGAGSVPETLRNRHGIKAAVATDRRVLDAAVLAVVDSATFALGVLVSWVLLGGGRASAFSLLPVTSPLFPSTTGALAAVWGGGTALMILAHAAAGLYPGFGLRPADRLRRRWLVGGGVVALLTLLSFLAGGPVGVVAGAGFLTLGLSPLVEDIVRDRLHRWNLWGQPVALLCAPENEDAYTVMLEQNWQLGFKPHPEAAGTVVVAGPEALSHPQAMQARELFSIVETSVVAPVRSPLLSGMSGFMGFIPSANPRWWPWNSLKRGLDCVGGGLALVLSLPLVFLTILAIYLVDPGPVFYGQYRRGLHGKPIRIWKLRSMYQDSQRRLERLLAEDLEAATEWYARFKLSRDPRVLPWVGPFIRKHSIDELPQLWSVMKGELSLVGPRVFVDYDLDVYEPDELRLRQSVLPGLTGLWQVSVRSEGDNRDKARYDTAYVKTWSFWLDLDILYRTVGVVLTGRGAI